MVAKLPLERGETDDATVMGYGYLPGIAKFSPFHSAAYAVVESCSKLAAVGANPLAARLTFQEYFPRLRHDPQRWGQPAAALLGALSAQLGLGIPAIGGKDSMSGSFESLDVPPTLVSFAVGMTKASRTVSAAFQRTGSQVLLLPLPENGDTLLPEWKKLRAYYEAVHRMAQNGQIASASVVKEGGVAAAVARMCFGNGLGFAFDPSCQGELARAVLFAPKSGELVIELAEGAGLDPALDGGAAGPGDAVPGDCAGRTGHGASGFTRPMDWYAGRSLPHLCAGREAVPGDPPVYPKESPGPGGAHGKTASVYPGVPGDQLRGGYGPCL